jgi:hypothetical protein
MHVDLFVQVDHKYVDALQPEHFLGLSKFRSP